ncbi:MAG TPA: TetR/AcrR family transcriptional regulator [Sphingomonas sp.]|jgi:AcrR family transcriptional regulator|uniref:TetR/AcrR family transcriptional regulator n=1 Tax=Sphingomonas sp. TaxID=28214 RepID=UPI002EDA05F7
MEKKRRATRAKLLEAAYDVMVEKGVDAATIREITDKADIGFGTFYNYFQNKEDLAVGVLDCMIHSVAQRNLVLTAPLQETRPDLAMAMSTRLLIRSGYQDVTLGWWARRPDLLADRLRAGLHPFVLHHIRHAIATGVVHIAEDNIEPVLAMLIWLVVGGMRDMQLGMQPPEADALITEGFMRVMGVSRRTAHELANAPLPAVAPLTIDFSFQDQDT